MNNTELIKLIGQYIHLRHQLPKEIKGYEKNVVKETINDMISKKVIFEGEVKKSAWEADALNRSKQYRRMMYCIDKELIKTEYEVELFKK